MYDDVIWIGTIGYKKCPVFESDGLLHEHDMHPVMVRDRVDHNIIHYIDMSTELPSIIAQLDKLKHKTIIYHDFRSKTFQLMLFEGHYENPRPLDYDYCKECRVKHDCPQV